MGLGAFGGGVGAVQFLHQRGARLTVTDQRPPEQLRESLAAVEATPPDRWRLGGHEVADFRDAELIVVNPAVKRSHPMLAEAQAAGVPLTSEMNLFWQHNPAPVTAVTGSNGKSTTTAMTASILRHAGERVWLGGNIGTSLLPLVDQIQPSDRVVLELSSFQLLDLDRLEVSPAVGVVTNFSPNHLDWHRDLAEYRAAKQTLFRWQSSMDVAIVNGDDPDVAAWPCPAQRAEFRRGDPLVGPGIEFDPQRSMARLSWRDRNQEFPIAQWLRLPGVHNLENALAASLAAVATANVSLEAIQRGLEQYQPLPHRLQWVHTAGGCEFYNDSLATTPESAMLGLQAFDRPVVLLAGGYDKHVDLGAFARAIAQRAKAVSLLGQTGPGLGELVAAEGTSTVVSPPHRDFRAAFDWAVSQATAGDVVLLSPGCASYDWFRNFADRGETFSTLARSL